MNKKSRAFLVVVGLAIVLSAGVTFWRIFIARDYWISFETVCDPTIEKCFVRECTPDDTENNPCSDTEATQEYYKALDMRARSVPQCNESNGDCMALNCVGFPNSECRETLCDDSAELPEGTVCNDPATYEPFTTESDALWEATSESEQGDDAMEGNEATVETNTDPAGN